MTENTEPEKTKAEAAQRLWDNIAKAMDRYRKATGTDNDLLTTRKDGETR